MSRLTAVAVVVPARNEASLLPDCLRAIEQARRTLEGARPDLGVRTVVVLDDCTDGSAGVVAARPEICTVVLTQGCVGAARAAGADMALGSGRDPAATWLANTDADTLVPPDWLMTQVALAEAGHDLILGTVHPHDLEPHLLERWSRRHRLTDGHDHVHGANLGVRGDAYLGAGGFPHVPLHEDVLLVDAVKALGARWVATDATRVQTAARLHARVAGGFATYLHELAAELGSGPTTVCAHP